MSDVLDQLTLTRTAAEGTAAAARRIVDDHEQDVSLLLGALRPLLEPTALARVEAHLSAPLAALGARRKQAKAHHAHAKRQASPQRATHAPADASGRPKALVPPLDEHEAASDAAGTPAAAWAPPWLAEALSTTQAVAHEVGREVARAARANSPFRGRADRRAVSPARARPRAS